MYNKNKTIFCHIANRLYRAIRAVFSDGHHYKSNCRLLFQKTIAAMLIAMLALPPTALASGITPDSAAPASKRPSMDAAANGVPVVNIAPPSSSGLSHNQFKDFSVDGRGAILNNAAKAGVSQLGGAIIGNPNLAKGHMPAKAILNEVTGSDRSRIEGYIEVFGKQADVLLANPNGITVNGGGFINTGSATLTTGKPVVDGAGSLQHFDVRQGSIVIEGQGINASNLTGFDLVSRAAEVNANLYAQDLQVTTGRVSYDPKTKKAVPLAGEDITKPQVAIDSSALGGMYAGRITLVSSEKGIGVNLAGIVQSTNNMAISSEGTLVINAAQAGGNVHLAANQHDLSLQGPVKAGKNLEAFAQNITTGSTLQSGAKMTLAAQEKLILSGQSQTTAQTSALSGKTIFIGEGATAAAAQTLGITAKDTVTLADKAKGTALQSIQIQAKSVELGQKAALASGGGISINTDKKLALGKEAAVSAKQSIDINSGLLKVGEEALLSSEKSLSITASEGLELFQKARVLGLENVSVTATDLHFNSEATLGAGKDLSVTASGSLDLGQDALLTAGETAQVTAENISLHDGATLEGKQVAANASLLSIDESVVNALQNISITANSLTMHKGSVAAGQDLSINARTASLKNSSVTAQNNAEVNAQSFSIQGHAISVREDIDLNKVQGLLFAGQALTLTSEHAIDLQGGLVGSDNNLRVQATSLALGQNTHLYSGKDMRLAIAVAAALDHSHVKAARNLDLQAKSLELEKSSVTAQGALTGSFNTAQVSSGSSLGSLGNLLVSAEALTNQGLVFSNSDAALRIGNTLSNLAGADIFTVGNLQLTGTSENSWMNHLLNDGGHIESLGGLALRAGIVENLGGSVEVTKEKYSQSYLHIGMKNSLSGYKGDGSFNLVSKGNAAGYRNDRKALSKVKNHLYAQQAEIGIPVGRARDHLQEWKTVHREEAVGDIRGASLMSGGDMTIDAKQISNTLSTISAGNNLTINADTLHNRGIDLYEHLEVFRHLFSMGKHNEWEGSHTQSWSSSRIYASNPAILTAGKILKVLVKSGYDNSGRANADYVGVYSGSPAYAGLNITGVGLNNPAASASGAMHGEASSKRDSLLVSSPLEVDLGGLFSLSNTPGHPYLIETNPALTNMSTFYGSNYFLSKIGYDPTTEHRKILGDAFYETRRIREQILTQSGQRYLYPGTDDAETMRRLMDNAAEQSEGLLLTVGVALTPDQIKNLTKDIVWLEEVEFQGKKALVPNLYLCEATKAGLTVRGGSVTGETVVLEGNNIANAGLIRGKKVEISSLTDILNRGGQITGQDTLLVESGGSILNQSGSISGGDLTLSAANDIRIETLTDQKTRGPVTASTIHQVAELHATGNVDMRAGKNILLRGADGSIVGKASLAAGNDILLLTASATDGYQAKDIKETLTGHIGSSLQAGELAVTAGQDLVMAGSSLSSKGDASITAGRNITAGAVSNEQESYLHISRGSSYTNTKHSQTSRSQGSALHSGGNLSVIAGTNAALGKGSLTLQASSATAEGDVALKAAGDILLGNAFDTDYSYRNRGSKKVLSSKTAMAASNTATSVGSIVSGTNVSITAGDNVLATGSLATAKNNLSVAAEKGDVIIAAAQDTHWETQSSKKSKTGLFGTSGGFDIRRSTAEKRKAETESNVGSLFVAGNDLTITAGRDASVIGSSVQANNDLSITAKRDVNLLPGREKISVQYSKKTSSTGLSANLSKHGLEAFAGTKSTEKGVQRTGDYTAGSQVAAGNDLRITAGQDVNQVGSHIAAGRDVAVKAEQDWNMTASHDKESLHQYVKKVQAGISASLRQSVSDTVETLIDLPEDMTAGKGGPGYKALTAASAGMRAVDAVRSTLSEAVSASVKAGSSVSKNDYRAKSSTARPSSVTAGRDITAEANRDIFIEGGQIQAGRDVSLSAGNDLTITSAKDSGSSAFSSSSYGGGVGLKAGVSTSGQAAAGVNISAQASGATSNTNYTSHTNARIIAGENLSTKSGRDTTVAGAHLEGNTVAMDVGRDLTVASLQDHQDNKSSSWHAGADVTVGYGAMVSGNLGMGKGKGVSDWVGQQTSIVGKEKTDIRVEKNTHIKGAIIATEPGGSLTLNTGTLTFEEIKDKSKGQDWSASLSGSTSISGSGFDKGDTIAGLPVYDYTGNTGSQAGSGSDKDTPGASDANNKSSNTPYIPDTGSGHYSSYDKRGVLRPTVTEGEIIVRDDPDADLSGLNRDLDRAREVTKDDKAYTDVYISPGALDEIFSGFQGITQGYQELAEKINELLPAVKKEVVVEVIAISQESAIAQGKSQQEANAYTKDVLEGLAISAKIDETVKKHGGSYENVPKEELERDVQAGKQQLKEISLHGISITLPTKEGTVILAESQPTKSTQWIDKNALNLASPDVAIKAGFVYSLIEQGAISTVVAAKLVKGIMDMQTGRLWTSEAAFTRDFTVNVATGVQSGQLAAQIALQAGESAVRVYKGIKSNDAFATGRAFGDLTGPYLPMLPGVKQILNPGKGIHPKLLQELTKQGVKHTPENIIRIAKNQNEQILFLEKGSPQSGLVHIIKEHGTQFIEKGIKVSEIPDLVMQAATRGKIIGYQGKGTGRPIFETTFNDKKYHVAVTIGSNGYIVGANPRSVK